ncbi:MAG: T9SS type A sorting domain-containing protein [Calditrichaceae bacterium]
MKKLICFYLLFLAQFTFVYSNSLGTLNTISTLEDDRRDLSWDWYSDPSATYTLYISGQLPIQKQLPFHDATGGSLYFEFINDGVKDIYPKDGWVLFLRDFGSPTRVVDQPFFILYNKYRGILRYFFWGSYSNQVSYVVGTMKFAFSESSPLFTNSVEGGGYVDDYPLEKHVLKKEYFQNGWNYLDFDVMGYDPNIFSKRHVGVNIDIEGYTSFDILINGELSGVQLDGSPLLGENVGSNTLSSLTRTAGSSIDLFEDISKEFKSLTTAQTNYEAMLLYYLNYPGDPWWADVFANIANFAVQDWIPALGPITSVINYFSGGGSSQSESLPLAIASLPRRISLEGNMVANFDLHDISFYLPGCIIDDIDGAKMDNSYPLYEIPLGVFNSYHQPITSYYQDAGGGYDQWDDECPWNSDIQIKIDQNLEIIVNPQIFSIISKEASHVMEESDISSFKTLDDFYYFIHSETYSGTNCDENLGYNFDDFTRSIALRLVLQPIGAAYDVEPLKIVKNYVPVYNDAGGLPAIPNYPPIELNILGPSIIYTSSGLLYRPTPSASGTYTADVSGGTGTYSYLWETRSATSSIWTSKGSSQSVTVTAYSDFYIRCTVTSGTQTESATKFVTVRSGEIFSPSENPDEQFPQTLNLSENYPNPFNPTTNIKFGLPENLQVKLTIYSVTGQKIITLVDGYYEKGYHEIEWNGRNEVGHTVASGVYIYELSAGNNLRVLKKMIFAK